MKNDRLELLFFFLIFVGVLALTFFLFLPFLSALLVALVFAVIFYPLHRQLCRAIKWRSLAAFVTTVFILLIVFVPLTVIGTLLFNQAEEVFAQLNQGDGGLAAGISYVESQIAGIFPGFTLDVASYARQGLAWLTGSLGGIFAGTAQAVLLFFIGIMALFFFLRDGEKLRRAVVEYSPLRDTYDEEIVNKLGVAINSIIRGSILIALIQGVLSGVGFTIFGVPHAALWGSVAALGALIPGIGTSLVLLPAVGYLFAFGSTGGAIGLLIWGVLAVGLIDNFLGPYLIGRGVRIHPLLVLLSVLGGLQFFGPVGFLLGPIVLALLLALAEIYKLLTSPANVSVRN